MLFSKLLALTTFALTSAASPSPRGGGLDRVTKKFEDAGIVPDVLADFNPVMYLYETYKFANGHFMTILLGAGLNANDTQHMPLFTIETDSTTPTWPTDQRFVLAVVDPDAPSRANPTRAQYRHYLQTDLVINGDSLASVASPATPYAGPSPPVGSGPHRYIAVLYAQPSNLDISFLNLTRRDHFNVGAFAKQAKLGVPVAGTFFTVEVV